MNISDRLSCRTNRVLVCKNATEHSRNRPASARSTIPVQETPKRPPRHIGSARCQTPSRHKSNLCTQHLSSRAQTPKPRCATLTSPFFKQSRVDLNEPGDACQQQMKQNVPLGRSPLRSATKANADLRPGSFSKKQILTTVPMSNNNYTSPGRRTLSPGVRRSDRLKELSRNFQLDKTNLIPATEALYQHQPVSAKKENVHPGTTHFDRALPWPEVVTEVEVVARMRAVQRHRPVRRR